MTHKISLIIDIKTTIIGLIGDYAILDGALIAKAFNRKRKVLTR